MGERIDYKLFHDSNSRAKYQSIGTISLNLVQEERRERERKVSQGGAQRHREHCH